MVNWLETLKGETQAKLLQALRQRNLSITALAEHVGLTDNAVRTHVAVLEREGLVEPAGTDRGTGGKPARLYTLTRMGEELFPKAYALVLGALIGEIARVDGDERAVGLLETIGRQFGAEYRAGPSAEERVQSAAAALRSLGGAVDVEREPDGWRLKGHGCPLAAATRDHPETCALARALIEEMTGMAVQECCERTGRPRCQFRVRQGEAG